MTSAKAPVDVARRIHRSPFPGQSKWVVSFSKNRRLLRAKDQMDLRYREPLTLADLADTADLSLAHFSREFRRAFGESPHRYLMARRLERAAAMLRLSDSPIAEVCRAVGLRSVGSFTTSFGRAFGTSPVAYRARGPLALDTAAVPGCLVRDLMRARISATLGTSTTDARVSGSRTP